MTRTTTPAVDEAAAEILGTETTTVPDYSDYDVLRKGGKFARLVSKSCELKRQIEEAEAERKEIALELTGYLAEAEVKTVRYEDVHVGIVTAVRGGRFSKPLLVTTLLSKGVPKKTIAAAMDAATIPGKEMDSLMIRPIASGKRQREGSEE